MKVTLFPDFPTLSPFVELLLDSPGFFVMFWNSCLQTGAVLFGQMVVAVPAAWAFAMYSFPGKKLMFMGYIILMILPFQVLMTPDYFVLNRLHLLDTHLAVILPGIFYIFVYGFQDFLVTTLISIFTRSLPHTSEYSKHLHISLSRLLR